MESLKSNKVIKLLLSIAYLVPAFLDIDNTDKLTVDKISIIEEAQRRIDPYIKIEDGKIELTIAWEYCQDFQNNNTIQGGIAGALLSFVKTPPVVGAAIAIGSAYLTYYQAKALYDAANNGSITVSTFEVWGAPEQGTTTTVKDQSGNTVIVF